MTEFDVHLEKETTSIINVSTVLGESDWLETPNRTKSVTSWMVNIR